MNPPHVNLDQNNNNADQMDLGDGENGIELLAESEGLNHVGEFGVAQDEEVNEVVIGLAAVLMEGVEMVVDDGNQEEA